MPQSGPAVGACLVSAAGLSVARRRFARDERVVVRELVDPRWARSALATDSHVAPPRPDAAERYTAAMLAGEWRDYSADERIQFTRHGALYDGIHRLHAVIRSGRATGFCVEYGVTSP